MRALLLIMALALPADAGQAPVEIKVAGVTLRQRIDFNGRTTTSKQGAPAAAGFGGAFITGLFSDGVMGLAGQTPLYYISPAGFSITAWWSHMWVKLPSSLPGTVSLFSHESCFSCNNANKVYYVKTTGRLEVADITPCTWSSWTYGKTRLDVDKWVMVDIVRGATAANSYHIFVNGALDGSGTGGAVSGTPTRLTFADNCDSSGSYQNLTFDDYFYATHTGVGTLPAIRAAIKRLYAEGLGRYAQ